MESKPHPPKPNGKEAPQMPGDLRAELEAERRARTQAEQRLRDAEERVRLVDREIADHAIMVLDAEGRITSWNEGACRLHGYTAAEAQGMSIARLFTAEDVRKGQPEHELRQAAATGRARNESWHVRKDGSRFWASGTISAVREPDGALRGFIKICRDLTESRQAEAALRESEHRLRIALTAAEMGIWRWKIEANRETVDDNFYRLLGRTPDGSIRKLEDLLACVHPEDRAALEREFYRSVRERAPLRVEFRVVWPDGTVHWLKDNGDIFFDSSNQPLYMTGICVDITRLKQLEAELRARAEALREADRRKDEFLAMLGHELRNPIAPIRTTLDLLSLDHNGDPAQERHLAIINRQVQHLSRLVDDLLDMSRINRGTIELRKIALDLTDVVRHAVDAVRPLIDARDHDLMLTLPTRPLWVDADPTRLEQVLANLLHNAAKYTDPHGRITVVAEREANQAVLRVRDTGKGIAPADLEKIFEVFVQVSPTFDRAQGGLGLGLSLARRLVEMHGGTITAQSAGPGKGSEFIIRLPLMAVPPARTSVPRVHRTEHPTPPQPDGLLVLVVDDNPDAAETLARLIGRLGHQTYVAHSAAEALELAHRDPPGLVLLDIGLPEMDGYETARRLRQLPGMEHARIVAVTGYGQERDRERSRQAGIEQHLVKPVSAATVQQVLEQASARR